MKLCRYGAAGAEKPGLIDADNNVTDESTRGFLRSFLDQFAALVARFAAAPSRAAA